MLALHGKRKKPKLESTESGSLSIFLAQPWGYSAGETANLNLKEPMYNNLSAIEKDQLFFVGQSVPKVTGLTVFRPMLWARLLLSVRL